MITTDANKADAVTRMDYDPNLTNSGRMAIQVVTLTFGMWKYRAHYRSKVRGNCNGLAVIECAVENIYESLPLTGYKGQECARMLLTNGAGDTLECEDEEGRGEDWLKDMLILAEITRIVPEKARKA